MAARKVVRKQLTTKARSKRTADAKRTTATRKKVAIKAPAPTRRNPKARKSPAALGRPRVAGTAELELMFRKDLEAREVFEFLRVRTLKELEAYSPDEILERLTAPVVRTIGRIRKALAMNNRCLAGDEKFAIAFKKQLP